MSKECKKSVNSCKNSVKCMLFTLIMSKRTVFSVTILVIILFFTWFLSGVNKQDEEFQKRVKVSLREVGNQLLLFNKDTTSLVVPIIAISNYSYLLSLQNELSFEPGNLVALIEKTFKKAEVSTDYLVEVVQCSDKEVAYSYQMKKTVEKSIIPCRGRFLPKNCYQIEVNFIHKNAFFFDNMLLIYTFLIGAFMVQFLFFKKKTVILKEPYVPSKQIENTTFTTIGSFQFYPTQNKLVKKAREISLSRKECELLEIFVTNPNRVIKRDELTKKVWEDHGVFVGRSLDTYISKLRKKLKEDDTIKLINVHGVGYKLEIYN